MHGRAIPRRAARISLVVLMTHGRDSLDARPCWQPRRRSMDVTEGGTQVQAGEPASSTGRIPYSQRPS